MSNESTPAVPTPGVPQPSGALDLQQLAELARQVVGPLAEADKLRSENDLKRYQRYHDSWDQEAARGHWRFVIFAGMVFVVIVLLLSFAFYAYVTGNPGIATHMLTAVVSLIAGVAAGVGISRRQQQR